MSSKKSETEKKILAETWRLMEEGGGRGVRMSDIAKAAGISRQAIYLHYNSRTELMIATTRYIDEVRSLDKRLEAYRAATGGVEMLEEFVKFWCEYIPEIYGLAKALLAVRETDEDAAAAWADRMNAVRAACRRIVEALARDRLLDSRLSPDEAVDLLWTLLSVHNRAQLVTECAWPPARYLEMMQELVKGALLRKGVG